MHNRWPVLKCSGGKLETYSASWIYGFSCFAHHVVCYIQSWCPQEHFSVSLTCRVIFIWAAPSVCTYWNPSDCEHKWREWQLKPLFVCTLFQDSKWVEEKQLFLQRNQVLLEKVWFNLIDLTFIKTEFSACPGLTIKGWRPGHCPAKGLASTSVLSKHFTQSSFAPLVRIYPKLHHITVLKQLTVGF